MKKNNAGVSIVELLMAITIISLVTGIGVYSFSRLTGYRGRECASKISSSISANKVLTLGKAKSTGNICWELYMSEGDYYVRTVRDAGTSGEFYENVERVSEGRLEITYVERDLYGNRYEYEVDSTNPLRFCFNRASGAICRKDSPYAVHDIREICVTAGTRDFVINLVPTTGKVVVVQ